MKGNVLTPTRLAIVVQLIAFIALVPETVAQQFDEQFDHWPVDFKINGTIVIANELSDVSILKGPLASWYDGKKVGVLLNVASDDAVAEQYKSILADGDATIEIKESTDDLADDIDSMLRDHQVFCWHSTSSLSESTRKKLLALRSSFAGFIAQSGTIVVTGKAAEVVADVYLSNSGETRGLDLIPDSVIELDYDDSAESRGRLLSVLATRPRSVGIGLEQNSAVVLSGRKIRVLGTGRATFLLMANERQPVRVQRVASRQSRESDETDLLDLTQWRREAIDRTLEAFPPAVPEKPHLENGALVIVGGGGMPDGLMSRFVELAGGTEKAKLVYVPCSEREQVSPQQSIVELWKRMGVKHATFIHTKDRNRANSDQEFLAPLREATGIWFGGGRQWNFADSYYGTKAHELMKAVLHRGGVVGGSSAGASIQARYLARATPMGNTSIMAPGYERGGLGFIGGVAIDQHFSQRRRQGDMTQLVTRYPQLLGIGIDETTAVVVQGTEAEVVGKGKVFFYDRTLPVYPDRADYIALEAGAKYDLANRNVLINEAENDGS